MRHFHSRRGDWGYRQLSDAEADDCRGDRKTERCEAWWFAHGRHHPELRIIAIRVMHLWTSASPAERNKAQHERINTARRNKLGFAKLAQLVEIATNLKLAACTQQGGGYVLPWVMGTGRKGTAGRGGGRRGRRGARELRPWPEYTAGADDTPDANADDDTSDDQWTDDHDAAISGDATVERVYFTYGGGLDGMAPHTSVITDDVPSGGQASGTSRARGGGLGDLRAPRQGGASPSELRTDHFDVRDRMETAEERDARLDRDEEERLHTLPGWEGRFAYLWEQRRLRELETGGGWRRGDVDGDHHGEDEDGSDDRDGSDDHGGDDDDEMLVLVMRDPTLPALRPDDFTHVELDANGLVQVGSQDPFPHTGHRSSERRPPGGGYSPPPYLVQNPRWSGSSLSGIRGRESGVVEGGSSRRSDGGGSSGSMPPPPARASEVGDEETAACAHEEVSPADGQLIDGSRTAEIAADQAALDAIQRQREMIVAEEAEDEDANTESKPIDSAVRRHRSAMATAAAAAQAAYISGAQGTGAGGSGGGPGGAQSRQSSGRGRARPPAGRGTGRSSGGRGRR
ncbi:hypothetical protein CBR_g22959 [Chara braunii]|uniref:Uncharacterized protein n=1 Tax=Chara braunii TaxID=69332 RepID=A0A388L3B7_CHABU|nr:hypothetical protein CBR_g22959 [Chara braunii]|eukprot:GBG76742.1 hypothetical protein CBR_g22959 [Chara braunii]